MVSSSRLFTTCNTYSFPDNYFRWGRKKVANKRAHSIMLSISGVQMDLRDVSFHIKKKQGFPSLTDTGVADIFLGGSGLSFKMKMSTAEKKDRQHFFKIDKVDVDVKNFNIKLKQSKHKVLFAIGKPMMLKVMRPALQKALEKMIKDKFNEFDALAYKVKLEADRAIQEASNHFQSYVMILTNGRPRRTQRTPQISTNAMSTLFRSNSCKESKRQRLLLPTRRSIWP
jgi:hypothetical protein